MCGSGGLYLTHVTFARRVVSIASDEQPNKKYEKYGKSLTIHFVFVVCVCVLSVFVLSVFVLSVCVLSVHVC